MSALIAGAALTLLLLDLDYNAANAIAVVNPLEKMLTFADSSTADAADSASPLAAILLLLQGLGSVLARYSFVLHTSPRPTVFLIWLIVPGIVVAWRRGERQAALQAAMLMLAALAIDTLGVRRGLKAEYFIFSDPLIIIAGAILLDSLSRPALPQMGVPDRGDAARPAHCVQPGRAGQICLQEDRAGIDLRMERLLHAADAPALVPRAVVTAC